MSLNSNTNDLNEILDTMNNLPLGGGGLRQIGQMIDESGVLDGTEGTVEEKVGELIHATDLFFKLYEINFYGIHSVERIEFYIDWATAASFEYARGLKYLKGVDTTKLTSCRQMFNQCNLLETIEIPFDMSKHNAWHMGNMFMGCSSLVNVGFVAKTIKESISFAQSSLLSAESIQSIIDGLAIVETAQTLTLNSAITFTDEQKATINSKGWTLVQ